MSPHWPRLQPQPQSAYRQNTPYARKSSITFHLNIVDLATRPLTNDPFLAYLDMLICSTDIVQFLY